MTSATTDPTTAVRWLTASGSDQLVNGKPVRAYGKDIKNHLVAVRTEDGVFPVENLAAVLDARKSLEAYYRAGAPGSYQQWLKAQG